MKKIIITAIIALFAGYLLGSQNLNTDRVVKTIKGGMGYCQTDNDCGFDQFCANIGPGPMAGEKRCWGRNMPTPICLSENTLIDTPSGKIPVQQIQKGVAIWSVNKSGERSSAVVVKTSKTQAPPNHQVVHLILNDGREIFVSPMHPTADGRTIGNLSVGDILDKSRIIIADKIYYGKNHTYDILPSGETGFYWANNILLDSTLH